MARSPLLLALLLSPVLLWHPVPPGRAAVRDRDAARFGPCARGNRAACVVDGDTIWYRGRRIHLADINTPETHGAGCCREARLGEAATARLADFLSSGPFSLESAGDGRDRDAYGRALRIATRAGESLGERLIAEGLAEPWRGRRGDWCN